MRLPETPSHIKDTALLTGQVNPQSLPHDILHRPPSGIGEVFEGSVEVRGQVELVHGGRG